MRFARAKESSDYGDHQSLPKSIYDDWDEQQAAQETMLQRFDHNFDPCTV